MIIKKSKALDTNLDSLVKYLPHDIDQFQASSGEPYKFYAYISTLINNKTILDVGTRMGLSALALSYNDSNKVISYDLLEQGASRIKKDNLEFKIMDFRSDDTLNYNNIDIIVIDVDPHDGIQEVAMLSFLRNKNWKGVLILDDILNNWVSPVPGANPEAMYNFWNELQDEKYDLTDVAHYSGTGLVNFGSGYKIEIS